MTDTPQLLLSHHLKALKLPTFLREYEKLARQCAAEGLDHVRFLLRLVELELIDRERRMVERRIKEAPGGQELRQLRLRGDSFAQQDPRPGTRPFRVRDPSRKRYRSRQQRNRQDAHRSRDRSRGLPERAIGRVLCSRGPCS